MIRGRRKTGQVDIPTVRVAPKMASGLTDYRRAQLEEQIERQR